MTATLWYYSQLDATINDGGCDTRTRSVYWQVMDQLSEKQLNKVGKLMGLDD